MPLTPNLIPTSAEIPPLSGPFDAMTAFCSAQTLTATGYLNNLNSGQVDLGGASPVSVAGRTDGIWNLHITAINMATGDEFYQFGLLGSNDAAFGNGNVELLAFHDLAAAASARVWANLLGASPAIPRAGIIQIPFLNLMQQIQYRYLQARLVVGGTAPSVSVSSWITRAQIQT